ncbi:MAG: response regulator [Dethiobacter sp.]|nr:response regulator [Dethiobacter sp.]
MEKIKLLIADDVPQTRKDIIRLLYFEDDMEVLGEAADGIEALKRISELGPDVVLMDINMPQMDGISATERICRLYPTVAVVIISIQGEPEYMKKAMFAGARDYLVKPLSSEEMASSIRNVYKQLKQRARQAQSYTVDTPEYGEQTSSGVESHHYNSLPSVYGDERPPQYNLPHKVDYQHMNQGKGTKIEGTVSQPRKYYRETESQHTLSHNAGSKYQGMPEEDMDDVSTHPQLDYSELTPQHDFAQTEKRQHPVQPESEQVTETPATSPVQRQQQNISKPAPQPDSMQKEQQKLAPPPAAEKAPAASSVQRQEKPGSTADEKPLGLVTTVFCGKGGVGKTTLATNLAVVLAQNGKKRVALIDLDLQFGDIAVMLNLNDGKTVSELVREQETVSVEVLENYMLRHFTGIDILPAPVFPQHAEYVTSDHVEKIITCLKQVYDYIIVDTSPMFHDLNLQALDMSDQILLVVTRDISTIKNAKSSLNILDSLNYREKIRVVLNRCDQDLGVDVADLEKGLEIVVSHQIPSDERTAVSAINKGVPVVLSNSSSELAKSFRRMSERMVSGKRLPQEKQNKPLINRIFSL